MLGLYRDGKLMDYDKDADIGIIIDEKNSLQHIQKIINIVNSNKNFLHTDSHKNLSQLQLQTSFIDTKRRVIIDIFFYHKTYYQALKKAFPQQNLLCLFYICYLQSYYF